MVHDCAVSRSTGTDAELAVIATVSDAVGSLPDQEARMRVINYVMARHLPGASLRLDALSPAPHAPRESAREVRGTRELPGIAQLSDKGDLRITIRDLKAKSALDAAVRLAVVATYAHEELTGQKLSSRRCLTPLLKQWRLYDGNSRARLAREKGIIREGDNLSLDAHARRDAERFIEEIRNQTIKGTWRP